MSDELAEVNTPQAMEGPDALFRRWHQYQKELPDQIDEEEAVQYSRPVIQWIRNYDCASMLSKFFLGVIAYLANPNWRTNRKYGKSIIENIAEQHNIHPNILREARRAAEFFGLDPKLYYQWVTEGDKPKNWRDVIDLIRAYSDPDVHGPDKLEEIIASKIERAGESIHELREMAHRGEADEEVVESVEEKFLDDIESWEKDKNAQDQAFEDPAPSTPRDEDYLDFIREQQCAACGQTYNIVPHHVEQGSQSSKGSDYSCIPLCSDPTSDDDNNSSCHDLIEDKGHRWLERKKNFRVGQVIARKLHKYATGEELKLPGDLVRGNKQF
jgi:hypothetical protein